MNIFTLCINNYSTHYGALRNNMGSITILDSSLTHLVKSQYDFASKNWHYAWHFLYLLNITMCSVSVATTRLVSRLTATSLAKIWPAGNWLGFNLFSSCDSGCLSDTVVSWQLSWYIIGLVLLRMAKPQLRLANLTYFGQLKPTGSWWYTNLSIPIQALLSSLKHR